MAWFSWIVEKEVKFVQGGIKKYFVFVVKGFGWRRSHASEDQVCIISQLKNIPCLRFFQNKTWCFIIHWEGVDPRMIIESFRSLYNWARLVYIKDRKTYSILPYKTGVSEFGLHTWHLTVCWKCFISSPKVAMCVHKKLLCTWCENHISSWVPFRNS